MGKNVIQKMKMRFVTLYFFYLFVIYSLIQSFDSGEDFKGVLPYMGMAAILVM